MPEHLSAVANSLERPQPHVTSVRDIVVGDNTTRLTLLPVAHAPRTCPSSCTACMPSPEPTSVEPIKMDWYTRRTATPGQSHGGQLGTRLRMPITYFSTHPY